MSNNVGNLESNARLTVLPATRHAVTTQPKRAPFFVETPESIDAIAGSTVQLRCQADGYPIPTIVWRHESNIVDSRETNQGFVLTLRNVSRTEEGVYECSALNDAGIVVSRANLKIRGNTNCNLY